MQTILISDMATTAKKISEELGKIDDFSEKEKEAFISHNWLRSLKVLHSKSRPKEADSF